MSDGMVARSCVHATRNSKIIEDVVIEWEVLGKPKDTGTLKASEKKDSGKTKDWIIGSDVENKQ